MSTENFESTNGIDPAEFGASLFDSPGASESEPTPPSLESSPSAPGESSLPAAENLTQAEWDALPKAWKKEMEESWKTASPDVRKYVHEREKQVTEGISRYSKHAAQWEQVTSPFKHLIENNPDADAAGIISKLAENHILIAQASPSERRAYLQKLAKGYGVDFADVADAANSQQAAAPAEGFTPHQIELLRQTLNPILQNAQQSSDYVNKQLNSAAVAEVDKFFSDPKNVFVNEVVDDILNLMKKGQAESLSEAYELAVLRNPSVKPRYIASLAQSAQAPVSQASKLPNVKSSATPRSPGKTKSTMDDTFADVLAKHYPS
jgi:hypothetical protein